MAIVDRLAMHALRMNIEGSSYCQHVARVRANVGPFLADDFSPPDFLAIRSASVRRASKHICGHATERRSSTARIELIPVGRTRVAQRDSRRLSRPSRGSPVAARCEGVRTLRPSYFTFSSQQIIPSLSRPNLRGLVAGRVFESEVRHCSDQQESCSFPHGTLCPRSSPVLMGRQNAPKGTPATQGRYRQTRATRTSSILCLVGAGCALD